MLSIFTSANFLILFCLWEVVGPTTILCCKNWLSLEVWIPPPLGKEKQPSSRFQKWSHRLENAIATQVHFSTYWQYCDLANTKGLHLLNEVRECHRYVKLSCRWHQTSVVNNISYTKREPDSSNIEKVMHACETMRYYSIYIL